MGFLHSFFSLAVTLRLPYTFFFYGDPGSGAMLWQLLTASFVGGAFYVAFAMRRIKEFFGKFGKQADAKKIRQNISS